MVKWVCEGCGLVYSQEEGDPEHGVAEGTPFERLPDDWVCPACGVDKNFFAEEGG